MGARLLNALAARVSETTERIVEPVDVTNVTVAGPTGEAIVIGTILSVDIVVGSVAATHVIGAVVASRLIGAVLAIDRIAVGLAEKRISSGAAIYVIGRRATSSRIGIAPGEEVVLALLAD